MDPEFEKSRASDDVRVLANVCSLGFEEWLLMCVAVKVTCQVDRNEWVVTDFIAG